MKESIKILQFDLPKTGQPMSFSSRAEQFQSKINENYEQEPSLIGELPGLDISDLHLWADDRLNIYASLDAAMTRTIVEAVQSLTELKRRIEEDALARTLRIATERDAIRREMEQLEEQKQALQAELLEARQEIEAEKIRKLALEKENEALQVEARFARDRLQEQMAAFDAQMSQMQETFRQTIAEMKQKSGYTINSVSFPPPPAYPIPEMREADKLSPIILSNDEPTPNQVVIRDKLAEEKKPAPEISAARLIEFSESPTPQYAPLAVFGMNGNGNGKLIETTPPGSIPLGEKRTNAELIEELFKGKQFAEEVDQKTNRPQRRNTQAEKRVNQVLRKIQTDKLEGKDQESTPVPPIGSRETVSEDTVDQTAPAQSPQTKERAKLSELGAKLGLDVDTPPDLKALRFADGYTPPPMPAIKDTNLAKERRPKTIEEIFNTPPTPEPALIGEIGPDVALQWDEPLKEPAFELPKRRFLGDYPIYPTKPPPSGSTPAGNEETLITTVTISNLNGLSLLMMERVVRTLPGVHHVTVTEFDRDQLVLEVTHTANIALEKVITTQPQLNKLRMVKSSPGVLEFVQDSTKIL